MELFKPSLVYDIVAIQDVYGPTGADPNIQALVVSKETASGGKAGGYLRQSFVRAALTLLVTKWTNTERRRDCHC